MKHIASIIISLLVICLQGFSESFPPNQYGTVKKLESVGKMQPHTEGPDTPVWRYAQISICTTQYPLMKLDDRTFFIHSGDVVHILLTSNPASVSYTGSSGGTGYNVAFYSVDCTPGYYVHPYMGWIPKPSGTISTGKQEYSFFTGEGYENSDGSGSHYWENTPAILSDFFNIIVDDQRPSAPRLHHASNLNGSVTITANNSSDFGGSGLPSMPYQYRINSGNWVVGDTVNVNPSDNVVFIAVDNVGNESYEAKIDIQPPTKPSISITDIHPSTMTMSSVVVTPHSSDPPSNGEEGIKGFIYSNNATSWPSISEIIPKETGYTFEKNGTIYCKAVDLNDNISSDYLEITITNIDKDNPEAASAILTPSEDGLVTLSWIANDSGSGIQGFEFKYRLDGAAEIPYIPIPAIDRDSRLLPINISAINAFGKNTVFDVRATDNTGNKSNWATSPSISIPPRLNLSGLNVFPTGLTEQENATDMEVDIAFDCSAETMKAAFSRLVLTRTTTSGAADAIVEIYPSTIQLNTDGSLIAPQPLWKIDSEGRLCYIDLIPVTSGAGNKTWTYEVTPYVRSGGSEIRWAPAPAQRRSVRLPNNKGSVGVSWDVLDRSGNMYGSTAFAIGATGEAAIRFQGDDPDRDDWRVQVERFTATSSGDYVISNPAIISGATPMTYTYENGYQEKIIPIQLIYGDNYIRIVWTEGEAPGEVMSSIKDLRLQHEVGKGYWLEVFDITGNQVPDTTAGILCSPGQPLTFTIGAKNGAPTTSIDWDFDDGSTASDTGPIQTHTYFQHVGQAEDHWTYTMKVTFPDLTESELRVIVQDTQVGTLWTDETWRGDHTIVGKVIVPAGMTLQIMSGQTVSMQGDIGSEYGQGIEVIGSLVVKGGVAIKPKVGQTRMWDAIMVEGSATIGETEGAAAEISGAERAVAAAPGSRVTLKNVRLTGNETGLHVVGLNTVSISGCEIIDNSLYGIKEDAEGRPIVRDTTLRGNFRNYYSWDRGLLNIGQINAIAGNGGNQGE